MLEPGYIGRERERRHERASAESTRGASPRHEGGDGGEHQEQDERVAVRHEEQRRDGRHAELVRGRVRCALVDAHHEVEPERERHGVRRDAEQVAREAEQSHDAERERDAEEPEGEASVAEQRAAREQERGGRRDEREDGERTNGAHRADRTRQHAPPRNRKERE